MLFLKSIICFSYVSRFRAPERINGETAYFFTHLMAAAEFIEKMDRSALKIDDEAYERYMSAAVEELNHRQEEVDDFYGTQEGSLEASLNEKLDLAEAKAEEIFLKAKEAFKVTGARANQAFSSFKESSLAKKSMEKLNRFISELKAQNPNMSDKRQDLEESVKMSLTSGGQSGIEFIEEDEKSSVEQELKEEDKK